jgi:nicotinate dehydrogenase subunit B
MGQPAFIHDMRLPGQLFGRVVRPPARMATLVGLDDSAVRAMPDVVTVVRDGSFLGVVASREEAAIRAADALAAGCRWEVDAVLPDEAALVDYLRDAPASTTVLSGSDDVTAPIENPSMIATFSRPYLAHASMGPSCGVAVWDQDVVRVWSHSQGVYNLGSELSRQYGLEPSAVIVEHVQGPGCYGHNAADDAAYDATLLARAVPGRPVQVVWSRPDELGWSPLGPAMAVQIAVGLDDQGGVRTWQHDIWSNGHAGRPGSLGHPPMLAAMHQDPPAAVVASVDPPLANGGGSGRNAAPLYDFRDIRVVSHRLDSMPLRTSALRALGAHLNVFAIEAVMDDLAAAAGVDPVDYRIGLLRDSRAIDVLRAAAARSGWGTPLPAAAVDVGRGIGLARYKNSGAYCAVVAEVEAAAELRVTRLTIAVDVGLAVNPDGVVNQIEGGALQAASWTLKERVRFDRERVTSTTWESYPILTFSEVPAVDVVLVGSEGDPPVGAGEASIGPTAGAIGNALYAAIGVRVRTLPLTPANIIAAMS